VLHMRVAFRRVVVGVIDQTIRERFLGAQADHADVGSGIAFCAGWGVAHARASERVSRLPTLCLPLLLRDLFDRQFAVVIDLGSTGARQRMDLFEFIVRWRVARERTTGLGDWRRV
jgi:hypothetical protein